MNKTILPTAALLALALAACARETDVDNLAAIDNDFVEVAAPDANVTAPADTSNGNAAVPDGNVINEADDAGSELPSPPGTPEASMIPGQYRGRWGMVPADCDRNRSDAKGAITIGERTIIFYESTATLKERRPSIATSFAGLFAFTGEGQSWEKVQVLTRTGDRLVRAEEGGRFTYTRCA